MVFRTLGALFLLGVLAILGMGIYVYKVSIGKFELRRLSLPTRVFADAIPLHAGVAMTPMRKMAPSVRKTMWRDGRRGAKLTMDYCAMSARFLPPLPSRRYEWKIEPSQRVQSCESWMRSIPCFRRMSVVYATRSTCGFSYDRSTKRASKRPATSSPTSKQQTRIEGPSHASAFGAPIRSSVLPTMFCAAPRQPEWMFAAMWFP